MAIGNRWFSPLINMTSCLASVTFKMASKVFIEMFMDILFRFLGSGDVKITIVIENQTFVTFATFSRLVKNSINYVLEMSSNFSV